MDIPELLADAGLQVTGPCKDAGKQAGELQEGAGKTSGGVRKAEGGHDEPERIEEEADSTVVGTSSAWGATETSSTGRRRTQELEAPASDVTVSMPGGGGCSKHLQAACAKEQCDETPMSCKTPIAASPRVEAGKSREGCSEVTLGKEQGSETPLSCKTRLPTPPCDEIGALRAGPEPESVFTSGIPEQRKAVVVKDGCEGDSEVTFSKE